MFGMDLDLAPRKGHRVLVVALDEGVDRLAQLGDRGEAGAIEGAAGEDREPDLDLVEPGGVGRCEVKADVLVSCQPQIALGLVDRKSTRLNSSHLVISYAV